MATQTHGHSTCASTLTGTHFSSTHTQGHPPPPPMGTHPVHPPPRTLTSPSTHLTNTQPHHAPHRALSPANTQIQQVPSSVGIPTGGHPHHRTPSPAGTHPPGPFNFGAGGSLLPSPRKSVCRRPRGWHSRCLPARDKQLQLSYLKILTLWNKVGGKIVYYCKQF